MQKKVVSYILILLTSLIIGLIGYYIYTGEISTERGFVPRNLVKREEDTIKELPKEEGRKVVRSEKEVEAKGGIYLRTEKETYTKGESFQILVYGDGQGEVVDGVEYVMEYDADKIELEDAVNGQFFTYLKNEIDNQRGEAQVIAIQELDVEEEMEEELLATYTVLAKERGIIEISFDKEDTSMAGYGGEELLNQTGSLTITIK